MPHHPSHAMVLAAGLGLRMRPLTDDRPKPLVRLAGRALIDYVLDKLEAAGVTHAVVNVHYRGEQLREHLKKRTSPAIEISDETDLLLDTGGGVKKALAQLGPEPIFTYNSDSLWLDGASNNLRQMGRLWDGKTMDALVLLAPLVASTGFEGRGDFVMDANGRLERRQEKHVAPFAYTGVQIIHPRTFKDTPDGPFSMNLIWDRAIKKGRLYGMRLDGRWMHVGSPDGLEQAERALKTL